MISTTPTTVGHREQLFAVRSVELSDPLKNYVHVESLSIAKLRACQSAHRGLNKRVFLVHIGVGSSDGGRSFAHLSRTRLPAATAARYLFPRKPDPRLLIENAERRFLPFKIYKQAKGRSTTDDELLARPAV